LTNGNDGEGGEEGGRAGTTYLDELLDTLHGCVRVPGVVKPTVHDHGRRAHTDALLVAFCLCRVPSHWKGGRKGGRGECECTSSSDCYSPSLHSSLRPTFPPSVLTFIEGKRETLKSQRGAGRGGCLLLSLGPTPAGCCSCGSEGPVGGKEGENERGREGMKDTPL